MFFVVFVLFAVCMAYTMGYQTALSRKDSGQAGEVKEAASGDGETAGSDRVSGYIATAGRDGALVRGMLEGNYVYTIYPEDNQTVKILSYLGEEDIVFVPEKLAGKTVGAIGEEAFSGNPRIEQVILPEGIVEIGGYAFSYCPRLQYVFMPQGVRVVGFCAFMCCPSLVELRFPEGIEEVGNAVCLNCSSLEKVRIPQGLDDMGLNAFRGCPSLRLIYGNSRFAEVYAQKEGYVYVDLDRIEEEGGRVW